MKECYPLLKKMEPRPVMWTGELTLKSMKTFLDGYAYALIEHALMDQNKLTEPSFHDWVANRLGFRESTAGWHNMILAHTLGLDPKKIRWENYDSDVSNELHEASIRQFYLLLDEFMKEEN